MKRLAVPALAILLLSACAALPAPVPVVATAETAGGPAGPGQPAIWSGGMGRNEAGLAGRSFVAAIAADGRLMLHDPEGAPIISAPAPGLQGIDVAGLPLESDYAVVVGGTERVANRTRIVLFRIDRGDNRAPERWGEIATDLSTPRGFCMRQLRGVLHAAAIDRRGEVRHFTITEGPGGAPAAVETGRFRLPAAGAGCAIDPGSGSLYFSHARQGFWRHRPGSPAVAPLWMRDPGSRRVPASRDLALLTDGPAAYLVSLDQDARAFSVWSVARDDLSWRGRIEVRDGPGGPAIRARTGIDAYGSRFGAFVDGVVVVGDAADSAGPNLKYVDWSAVKTALGL